MITHVQVKWKFASQVMNITHNITNSLHVFNLLYGCENLSDVTQTDVDRRGVSEVSSRYVWSRSQTYFLSDSLLKLQGQETQY